MRVSFKRRIALYNTTAVAVLTLMVFVTIYAVVFYTSFLHLDNDISLEKEEVLNTLDWKDDSILINKMPEWEEAEHKKVEVNPTFIQIIDNNGHLVFKSANLRNEYFLFDPTNKKGSFINGILEKQHLRLGQFPILNDHGKIIGQLTIGISQQESYNVLDNLFSTLCIAFPVLLLILYIVIYLTASKAIAPVYRLIKAASGIHDSTLDKRLPLPENKDEIYILAKSINELLSRIENSNQQQKQFTADASHEIRTPLTAIRGTLEVLLRKSREPQHYEEKIGEVIEQTEKLNLLLDQLLQLARLESTTVKREMVSLNKILDSTIAKGETLRREKAAEIEVDLPENVFVFADPFSLQIMLDNIFVNAIKYGSENGKITCSWNVLRNTFSITNKGDTISEEQIPFLFNRFYRTDDSRSSQIPGSGLGLAIVKKLADLQGIEISVLSRLGSTTFSLQFPE